MKILFIDTAHPILRTKLEEAGHVCTDGSALTESQILGMIDQFDGIILRSRIRIDKNFIDKGVRLKFIGRVGAGMESIDVSYAQQKGIACLNSPEGNRDAVGEHALGMLLALFNNICRADREVKEGRWNREANRGVELLGKTIGIIGYGMMASALAKKVSGFDCRVIAYDKYKKNFSDAFVTEVTMDDIFSETDILSLHIPLSAETEYLVNDAFISSFRKNIYVVNTARGKCVRTDDLVKHLRTGKVSGACLDTLEFEDTSFEAVNGLKEHISGLLEFSDRVVLSPHIAGWTKESNVKLALVLAEKIISLGGGA